MRGARVVEDALQPIATAHRRLIHQEVDLTPPVSVSQIVVADAQPLDAPERRRGRTHAHDVELLLRNRRVGRGAAAVRVGCRSHDRRTIHAHHDLLTQEVAALTRKVVSEVGDLVVGGRAPRERVRRIVHGCKARRGARALTGELEAVLVHVLVFSRGHATHVVEDRRAHRSLCLHFTGFAHERHGPPSVRRVLGRVVVSHADGVHILVHASGSDADDRKILLLNGGEGA